VTRLWTPRLRRAGLRFRNQTRHSFASLLIPQGESLAYVRDPLGHHSIALTVDVDGHLVPGGKRQAVKRLDAAPTRNPGATTAARSCGARLISRAVPANQKEFA
jgi:hypothetical protein